MRALKDYTIQYFNEDGDLCVAHVRAYDKEDAAERVSRMKEDEGK